MKKPFSYLVLTFLFFSIHSVELCGQQTSINTNPQANLKFTSAYTAAGLTPDGSSTFHLPRSIGKKRTMELMLTNRVLSAEEALDWGLINSVVNDEDVINETNKLAEKIARGPTKAFGGVKEMIRQSFSNGLETQMELESQIFSDQLKGEDGPEGIEAFTSKRKPDFKGR